MGGLHLFNQNSELGVADRPDATSQRNSLLAGLRLGVFPIARIGFEAELGAIPTVARDSGFSVVDLTFRAHLVVQLRGASNEPLVVPFLVAGAGALSVVYSNNENFANDMARNISSDTDAAYYLGGGVKRRFGDQWGLRADFRVLAVPSSDNTVPADPTITKTTVDFEAMVSLYADLARDEAPVRIPPPPPPPTIDDDPDRDAVVGAADQCPEEPEDKDYFEDQDGCPDPDNDSDGFADADDTCPLEAEDRDLYQDDDGCPEPDNDLDGMIDKIDSCPSEPEDKDGFQDDDGCTDPDNDGDGVADFFDKCPAALETHNGYRDDDGCIDMVPDRVARITGGIPRVHFKINGSELSPTSRRVLDSTVAFLVEMPELKLEIRAHTDGANNLPLSQKRADAVRDYLIIKGIDPQRLTAKGYGDKAPLVALAGLRGGKLAAARAKNRRIELKLPGTP